MPTCYASEEDCKSALGRKMHFWRAERPDEWTMDEFRREIRRICGRCRSDYVFAHTGMNLDVVLSEYLASRMATRRSRH